MSEETTMPDVSDAQNTWVVEVLGFDPAGGGGDEEGGEPGRKSQKRFKGKKNSPDGRPQVKGVPMGLLPDSKLKADLQTLMDQAAALKKIGFDTTQMLADAADFGSAAVKAANSPDPKRAKSKLDAIAKRVKEAVEHAQALAKSVKDIMGDKSGKPAPDQKSAIYKKALEDLYGLKIDVPEGMTNTHFDKVFDMFGTVPKGDVKQEQLKSLTYSKKKSDAGGGAYGGADIEMGDFGDAKKVEEYEINGKKVPANSFNVTTLHEIGHSVDERDKVMDAHQGKAGCGGWKRESLTTTALAFVTELKASVKLKKAVSDKDLTQVVGAALKSGTTAKPSSIEDAEWQLILPFLADNCLAVKEAADPWFESSPVEVAGRVFQEAYTGEWWSYTAGARATTKVNDYQWRSPAEWFAEVYAISWLSKKKPPNGVDSALRPYMWK